MCPWKRERGQYVVGDSKLVTPPLLLLLLTTAPIIMSRIVLKVAYIISLNPHKYPI